MLFSYLCEKLAAPELRQAVEESDSREALLVTVGPPPLQNGKLGALPRAAACDAGDAVMKQKERRELLRRRQQRQATNN